MLTEKECEKALEEIENIYYNLDDSLSAMKFFKQNLEKLYELKKEYFELVEYAKKLQDEVDLYKYEYYAECDRAVLLQKELNEIKNPKPYKFEDLKVGMLVVDTKPDCEEFTFIKITKILSEFDCEYLYHDKNKKVFFDNMTCHAREFEEGRFFPVTIAMEYQE